MVFLLGILVLFTSEAQDTRTLAGIVTDANTGEELVGVSVYEEKSKTGTVSDESGSYSLNLSKGNYEITYRFIGYKTEIVKVRLNKDVRQDIQLFPSTEKIDEVEISAEAPDHNVRSTEISMERLNIQEVERIPVIMGETDIMKTIQLLPGITSIAEGESGYIVRGSGFDQNLILMDDMPIYYSSHMQGLYSVFNSDAVDGLTVYKGGTPARFGGRGASVLDVRMRESGFDAYRTKLSIGLITSKFSVEAPVIKDKLSVFVGGRSTRLGLGYLYDQINSGDKNSSGGKGGGKTGDGDSYTFFDPYERWYDLNAKVIYKLNDKNRFYFSGYYGQDYAITVGETDWGNRAGSIRWSHDYNSKLTSNTSLIYSQYYTHNVSFGGLYVFRSGITTSSIKQEFSWFPNDKNDIRFGFHSEYQDFNHGGLEDTSQDDAGKFMPPMQGLESALYIENDHKINDWLSAHYGLRWSIYHQLGPGEKHVYDEESNESISSENYPDHTDVISSYNHPEPRLALTFLLNENSSIKTSFNRNAQYLRLMSLGGEIQWYDIWMPTTSIIPPMLTDQVAAGYFRNFFDHQLKFSGEVYYKWLTNAADFEDGLHNYLVDNLEAYVATGKGRAYGLELSLEKPKGRFTGRISYNLGKSEYQIDVINSGRWYPNMFDKTQSLVALASYELFHNLTISATFLYSTGAPITLPEAYYNVSGVNFPFWEGRNKYRLPDYHRLDFGLKYEPDFMAFKLKNRHTKSSLELSFYNVYNRRNIRAVGLDQGAISIGSGGQPTATFQQYGISTYGFMPSFQINFQF
jgi:hypothetical protein